MAVDGLVDLTVPGLSNLYPVALYAARSTDTTWLDGRQCPYETYPRCLDVQRKVSWFLCHRCLGVCTEALSGRMQTGLNRNSIN